MKLNSYYEENGKLLPLEVEVEVWPGLPDIHFLGGADQHLKESAKRIKSAIRSQGFEFRPNLQVLVNLRPSYLKKSSRGLELAVAIGYLIESGQLNIDNALLKSKFYGELSLKGDVSAPENLGSQYLGQDQKLVTGPLCFPVTFPSYSLSQLQDILTPPPLLLPNHPGFHWAPPDPILNLEVPMDWGRKLGILSLGRHSVLMAGASGSGKTTSAKILHALMPYPNGKIQEELLKQLPELPTEQTIWLPFINPHHTIPLNSMIGGGSEAHGGELARSHRGTLLLDEFFEFSAHVLESLREPLESKILRVSRGKIVRTFPLDTHVVATTNLCPCGEWVPGRGAKPGCRFSLQKCRSYSSRVTGPLLDRFEVLIFTSHHKIGSELVKVSTIRNKLEELRKLSQQDTNQQALSNHPWLMDDALFQNLSERRKAATIRLARSIALWDSGSPAVKAHHIEQAAEHTIRSFQKMKQWDLG
jgi:magnesium chelatase family protein